MTFSQEGTDVSSPQQYAAVWGSSQRWKLDHEGTPLMGRTEYYSDPDVPSANTLIPASNLLVVDEDGAILLQRRPDTGQWALPGGAQEIGETAAECAVRECLEFPVKSTC
jgi:NUDIX domain